MELTFSQIKQLCEYSGYSPTELDFDNWDILTDEEADKKTKEYIDDSLCFFNTDFLLAHTTKGVTKEALEALQHGYEDSNGAIKALIEDYDHFVDDVIKCDGRGNSLSCYDGEELELRSDDGSYVYAYRTN